MFGTLTHHQCHNNTLSIIYVYIYWAHLTSYPMPERRGWAPLFQGGGYSVEKALKIMIRLAIALKMFLEKTVYSLVQCLLLKILVAGTTAFWYANGFSPLTERRQILILIINWESQNLLKKPPSSMSIMPWSIYLPYMCQLDHIV